MCHKILRNSAFCNTKRKYLITNMHIFWHMFCDFHSNISCLATHFTLAPLTCTPPDRLVFVIGPKCSPEPLKLSGFHSNQTKLRLSVVLVTTHEYRKSLAHGFAKVVSIMQI